VDDPYAVDLLGDTRLARIKRGQGGFDGADELGLGCIHRFALVPTGFDRRLQCIGH
jgi:hypothetical protein